VTPTFWVTGIPEDFSFVGDAKNAARQSDPAQMSHDLRCIVFAVETRSTLQTDAGRA